MSDPRKILEGCREVSLFTGAGGGILGTHLLGATSVAYCEWADAPREMLKKRMADGLIPEGPVEGDVQAFDGKPWHGKAEILSAGFPCFVAGTKIRCLVPGNNKVQYVPIEDVQVGWQVWTHQGRWRPVTTTMARTDALTRKIVIENLTEIETTDEHPFHAVVNGILAWVNAQDLAVGQLVEIVMLNGEHALAAVKSNQPTGRAETVYNIAVQEDESYVANGAVAHNCQPFSVAGDQKAVNDPRNMWPQTVRIVQEIQPRYAFLENVPGLLSLTHGYFKVVLKDLHEAGLPMVWDVVPTAAAGGPHRRERLWMLAPGDGTDPESIGPPPIDNASEEPLPRAAKMWPTPMASDTGNRQGSDKWLGTDLVCTMAEHEFIEGNIPKPVAMLNPDWVEWLMGWPIGWTKSGPLDVAAVKDWEETILGLRWWPAEPEGMVRFSTEKGAEVAGRLKAGGNGQSSPCAAVAFESLLREMRPAVVEARAQIGGKPAPVPPPRTLEDMFDPDIVYDACVVQRIARWDASTSTWRQAHGTWATPGNQANAPEYVAGWPRAGLLLDGWIFERPSAVGPRGPHLSILAGRRPATAWIQAEPGDMCSTPVAYDATPGGPGNHYHGLGWQAKAGLMGGPVDPVRAAKSAEFLSDAGKQARQEAVSLRRDKVKLKQKSPAKSVAWADVPDGIFVDVAYKPAEPDEPAAAAPDEPVAALIESGGAHDADAPAA